MFGFFKNLLGHQGSSLPPVAKPVVPSAPPASKPVTSATPGTQFLRKPALSANNHSSGNGNGHSNGNGAGQGKASINSVQLLLQPVLDTLPTELRRKALHADLGGAMVVLPVEKILPQLSRGVVKITFGELRAAAPGVFLSHTDRDHIEVVLPLAQVLSQLNPALLARRPAKVQIQVPDEVNGPFSGRGQGLFFSTNQNNKVQPAPAAPQARSVTPAPAPPATMVPHRTNFVPLAPPTPPAAMPVSAPPVIPKEPVLRMVPLQPVSAAPTPPPKPSAPAPAAAPAVSEIPDMFVPADPAATEPAPEEEVLSVPLASLATGWPETVRGDIVRLNLMATRANLPVKIIEPALRLGKVAFKWGVIRAWIKPAPLLSMSPHDEVMLQLPLDVLAPLFFERKKIAGKRTKVAIDENIPDLFFGFPQPDSLASGDTHAVTKPTDTNLIGKEEPEPVLEAVAAPVAAPAPPQDTNYYVWQDGSDTVQLDRVETIPARVDTEFIKRSPTPNDIVTRAASLENVAGALIALPDGLMVAGQIPPDLNGDTLAGFVPHIFNKVGQAANELRMGELNNVAFTVGNVPWKIFKVNAVLFAAFGKAGQPMPTAKLAALAAELDQKNR